MKKASLFLLIAMGVAGDITAAEHKSRAAREAEQRLLAYRRHPMSCEEFKYLLNTDGVNIDATNNNQMTLLVKQIIDKYTNPEHKSVYEQNITELIHKGANFKATSFNGYTPLMWAAINRDKDTIKLMLAKLKEQEDGYDEMVQTTADIVPVDEELVTLLTPPAPVKLANKC